MTEPGVTTRGMAFDPLQITSTELATLLTCLGLPSLAGFGVDPFAGRTQAESVAVMATALRGLEADGSVTRVSADTFRVRDEVADLLSRAARCSGVLRVVSTVGDDVTAVAFVYGDPDLAVVHDLRGDGSHQLVAKPVMTATSELLAAALATSVDGDGSDTPIILTRGQLDGGTSAEARPDDSVRVELLDAVAAAAGSLRVDLLWQSGAGPVAPYVVVVDCGEDPPRLFSGIGDRPEDLVTVRVASSHHVEGSLRAMWKDSVFDRVDGSERGGPPRS